MITLGAIILDFELAPANQADLTAEIELLESHADPLVYGEKGYISAAVTADLLATTRRDSGLPGAKSFLNRIGTFCQVLA